ncbi:HEAT repeat domain-containing protein [Limnoraphis robusta]|uniref:HEAT repeat domain-containing protein n=1 Tax=Limnoraphis robusta TaxID=1118279 RepID=UPI00066A768A|nr:HEAT repeat domain-containing protein [Limnoraphis robusta]
MEILNLAFMLIAAAFAGLGAGFWWWDKRLKTQKRAYESQIRQQVEQLEKDHQNRIKETVQSLRLEYEANLRKQSEETEQYYQQKLNEVNESWRDRLVTERRQLTEQIQVQNVELDEVNQSLSVYETQLGEVNQQLADSEQQVQQMNQSLKVYEAQLGQMSQQLEVNKAQVQGIGEAINLYGTQLQQLNEENETTQAEIQSRMGFIEEQHQADLSQLRQDLEASQESQIQNAIANLEQEYRVNIRRGTDQLVRSMQENPQTNPELSTVIPSVETAPEPIVEEQPQQMVMADPIVEPEAIEDVSTVEEATSVAMSANVPTSSLPNNEAVNTYIIETINHWGNSGLLSTVPQLLNYAQHQNDQVREQLALALGKIASTNGLRTEIQQAIPTLAKLSQDSNPQVRQDAVKALGEIKSEKVIPFLQRALRDSNYAVVRAATVALEKFKSYPVKQKEKPQNLSLQKPNPEDK